MRECYKRNRGEIKGNTFKMTQFDHTVGGMSLKPEKFSVSTPRIPLLSKFQGMCPKHEQPQASDPRESPGTKLLLSRDLSPISLRLVGKPKFEVETPTFKSKQSYTGVSLLDRYMKSKFG